MKSLVLKAIHKAGYTVQKLPKKSKRSNQLSFYETATGNYYLPTHAHGDIICQAIINNQVFDENIINAIKPYITTNSSVLDVGANFGQMSILLAQMHNKSIDVHSFEASEFIYNTLNKSIQANNLSNITTYHKAVFDKNDVVLSFPKHDFERFATYGSYGIDYTNSSKQQDDEKIETITIDSINFDKPISIMKVDVQGGDLQVLKGAKNTIKKYKMPIIFEYEYLFEQELNLSFQEYVDFVQEIGYKFLRVIDGINFLIVPK